MANTKEHMYVEYDDGRERLIARGEPSPRSGLPMLNGALSDNLRVSGSVVAAASGRDFGTGRRLIFEGFLPTSPPSRRRRPPHGKLKTLSEILAGMAFAPIQTVMPPMRWRHCLGSGQVMTELPVGKHL